MFIKNILIGLIGLILFPITELILFSLGIDTQKGIFLISGIFVSLLMIAYYFVNVYVIGKSRSFFTLFSSWLMIVPMLLPLAYLPYLSEVYLYEFPLTTLLLYISLGSITLSWLLVLIEVFRSGTFKAY